MPDQPTPPADRAALRKAVADAIRNATCTGNCGKPEEECFSERIQPVAWHHGRLAVVEGEPEQFADAAVTVLPEPADRAAVLHEAADRLDASAAQQDSLSSSDYDLEAYAARQLREQAAELRRMADETPAAGPLPRRGDAFEAWLKAQRNRYNRHGESSEFWHEFDQALDEYRLHADMGVPLDGHVCEAKVIGDCECLEQPAAGARQDGAQR